METHTFSIKIALEVEIVEFARLEPHITNPLPRYGQFRSSAYGFEAAHGRVTAGAYY